MKTVLLKSITGVIVRVKITDQTSSNNSGLTGLTNASAGLRISTIADSEAAPTVYTQAGGTIDSITTLGTFAAPAVGHSRFREIDSVNHPGWYELQFADGRWAVAGARVMGICVTGALNAVQLDAEIQLTGVNPDDSLLGMADLANGVDTGLTWRQALRLLISVWLGKVSGSPGNTLTFRDTNDTVNRVVMQVDANGNRTSVVTSP